jgi:uncharacterized membrane-anchored protein YitT (DUF2179 family)
VIMNYEELIKYFRMIHESDHKIWFTIEEIEEIIKKFKENESIGVR